MVKWDGPMHAITMSMTHDLLLIIMTLLNLLLPSSSLQKLPPSAPQGSMLMEDKIRLGSTPPSCHNRCNDCNPCKPVQVPTLPTGSGSVQGRARPLLDDRPVTFNQYSNYKPLGWRCQCGDRLFNP